MEFVLKEKNSLAVAQVDVILHCKCGVTLPIDDIDIERTSCCYYPEDPDEITLEVQCPACKRVYECNKY